MQVLYITVILMCNGIMFLLIEWNLYSPLFLYVHICVYTVTKDFYTDSTLKLV